MSNNIRHPIKALEKPRLFELQAKFAEVVGEQTRCPNKIFLIRKISEALQAAEDKLVSASIAPPVNDTPVAPAPTTAPHSPVVPSLEQPPSPTAALEAIATVEPGCEKLTKLTLPELQARYLQEVGRPSSSTHVGYLSWKIREARKGRVPVGPRKSAHREGTSFKVLPWRMETALVEKLDEAWKRQGFHSRAEFFRKSLKTFLASAGENDTAALFEEPKAAAV